MSDKKGETRISGDAAAVIETNHGTVEINHRYAGDVHAETLNLQVTPATRPKIKVIVATGPEHVSEEQKARLKELVGEVVRLESLLKRTPKTFGSVWSALNSRLRVSSYHLIPGADAPRAEKYLREWIGRLSSAKSAPGKDANWRNRKYSYIFTNVKQLGAEVVLRERLMARHGTDSMKELSDAHLEAIYQLVAGWKKAGHAPGQAPA
ncbi:MAG TPA: hypothetical protein PLU47_00870 [Azonexus sp.]|nr:hypothetical protein [Azonexus sp.]